MNPFQPPGPIELSPQEPTNGAAFRSPWLVLLLVGIILFAYVWSFGLGVLATIASVPAALRASATIWRRLSAGYAVSTADKIGFFLVSLGMVALCMIAGMVAFFGTCLVLSVMDSGPIFGGNEEIALGVASMGFLAAAGLLFWITWPRRLR